MVSQGLLYIGLRLSMSLQPFNPKTFIGKPNSSREDREAIKQSKYILHWISCSIYFKAFHKSIAHSTLVRIRLILKPLKPPNTHKAVVIACRWWRKQSGTGMQTPILLELTLICTLRPKFVQAPLFKTLNEAERQNLPQSGAKMKTRSSAHLARVSISTSPVSPEYYHISCRGRSSPHQFQRQPNTLSAPKADH